MACKIPTLRGLRIELGPKTLFSPAPVLWHFASMPQSLSAVYLHAVFSTKEEWINEAGRSKCRFAWQAGYGIFSVSPSNVEAVRTYILEQEERHKKVTFQDEFRALLRKHGLEWDERYVWD